MSTTYANPIHGHAAEIAGTTQAAGCPVRDLALNASVDAKGCAELNGPDAVGGCPICGKQIP